MSFASALAARALKSQPDTSAPAVESPQPVVSGMDEMRRAVEAFKSRQGITDNSRVRVLTADEYRKARGE
jgi:hypothetical protein